MSILLAAFFILSKSNARPTLFLRKSDDSNTTSNAESGWVAGPTGRGTWGLILGCLTTLSLCAWTAYHPNISPHNSPKAVFFRRLKWMLAAVSVPELVLYCAWEQRWAANKLRNEINALGAKTQDGGEQFEPLIEPFYRPCRVSTAPSRLEVSECLSPVFYSQPVAINSMDFLDYSKTPTSSEFEPWTTEQAFFAVCGGFAVESSSFWNQKQLTFTPQGILELAKAGILPKISASEISDKSKANVVAKLLVCFQAGWFLVQCVARLVQGLPLTLFEIHVLTHVICAFVMYFLWMDKPYDVGQPYFSKDESVIDLAALFAVDSHLTEVFIETFPDRRFEQVQVKEIRAAHASSGYSLPRLLRLMRSFLGADEYNIEEVEQEKDHIDDFEDPTWRLDGTAETEKKVSEHHMRANRALERLRLSRRAALSECREKSSVHKILRYREPHVVFARNNMKIDGTGRGSSSVFSEILMVKSWSIFGLICAIYGGAHLSAWTSHFPTTIEMWFWRSSGIVLTTFPLGFLGTAYLADLSWHIYPGTPEKRDGMKFKRLRKLCRSLVFVVLLLHGLITICVIGGAYPIARIYILVEGLASLRDPPAGTYQDVKWANFIPHAG